AELEVRALHLAAEAHPVDLEVPGVALGDAGDGVGQQRAGEPVLGPLFAVVTVPVDGEHTVIDGDVELRVDGHGERALGALDLDLAAWRELRLDALRQVDRRASDAGHHHTSQTISPPTLSRRASRSAIRPREVETMATPRPPRTTGTCSDFA